MLVPMLCQDLDLIVVVAGCSLVADKLRTQDISGAGDALSSALFVATTFGLIIQAVLLVCTGQTQPLVAQSHVFYRERMNQLTMPEATPTHLPTASACLCSAAQSKWSCSRALPRPSLGRL